MKLTKIISLAPLFILLALPVGIVSASTTVEESPSIEGTPADIPDDATKIIDNSENHVEYVVDEGGIIQDSTGQDIQVPINVDTDIQVSDDGQIFGETVYTANLEEAVVLDDKSEDLLLSGVSFLKNGLLGTSAFAQTSNTGTYTHDKGNHVSVSTTVNWSSSGINKKINNVSGNYYIFTSGFHVKNSSVKIGESNLVQSNISKTWNLGATHDWKINCNYPYRSTSGRGVAGGANYSMTITNGKTSYSVTLYNTVWGG